MHEKKRRGKLERKGRKRRKLFKLGRTVYGTQSFAGGDGTYKFDQSMYLVKVKITKFSSLPVKLKTRAQTRYSKHDYLVGEFACSTMDANIK